ncbi:tRNA uracil 4-sulfurtransferase ThiI [Marinicrinis lubricantis]|uniref:Probable tRNA sulfurtransferase n=1 Tax=Marinicrinis lubricantis TaxID=2086470 RepID=A0ABW1IUS2_9BACL
MQPDHILLRFGELTLKGRNRSRFENQVVSHVQRILKGYPNASLSKTFGRVYIELNGEPYEPIKEGLKKVFGLSSFSPVLKCAVDLEEIQKVALSAMLSFSKEPKTFKVRVKRAYKAFPYVTQELNHLIGSYVLRQMKDLKVDVHHPEVELTVEIREEGTFVYSETVQGAKGLPVDSSGKSMLMLSGGIDSPVAGWYAMRRGIQIEAVHFHSYPYTSERAKQKVIDLTRILSEYTKEIKLHLVPFTEIQTRLKQMKNDNLLITLMRRAMFRITEKLAEKEQAMAIITGENLGQVASQTMPSLHVINKVTGIPVLRPLIMMEKQEIIRVAEEIGTYETSILPYEDCCTIFLPKSPSTNPNLRLVEKLEAGMDWMDEEIDRAVRDTEVMTITSDMKDEPELSDEFERLF